MPEVAATDGTDQASVIDSPHVAVFVGRGRYSAEPPYCPQTAYPEYSFSPDVAAAGSNPAYEGVRQALSLLGLDAERRGTDRWNPLGQLIRPGETVVLKPNFVRDSRETQPGDGGCLITHGSVIRAVLDYVYIALSGRGRIVIVDAPQDDGDFQTIRRMAGLGEILSFYRDQAGFEVEVYDIRSKRDMRVRGVTVRQEELPGDPAGYARVNLAGESAFAEINDLCHLLYGADCDVEALRSHHHGAVHEYLISRTVLSADCVINLPKLKTHKKTGITCCMKNLVGMSGDKNWLPHHREGGAAGGGDQFADDGLRRRLEHKVVKKFARWVRSAGVVGPVVALPAKWLGELVFGDTNRGTIRSGNWYGNDTAWRMVNDLSRVLLYADAEGTLHDHPVRRVLNVVDAIVAGEGNGPLDPSPRPIGVVLAGMNPVAVDLACARLMGFDYRKMPLLCNAVRAHKRPLCRTKYNKIRCLSNQEGLHRPLTELNGAPQPFQPHFGWKGHIELHREP